MLPMQDGVVACGVLAYDRGMARYPHRWPRPVGRPAGWEDLRDVPEEFIGEIVAGEIVVTPRPDLPHTRATSDLGVILGGPFRMGVGGPGGWVFLDEPRIRFGDEVRVPDMAGWRSERWVGASRRGPIAIRPDWICEVLSRSTETEDRTRKMPLYAREQVPYLWLINPEVRTLEVYRLEREAWLLLGTFADDAMVAAEPFDAISFELAQLREAQEPEADV
jgi:Uma2 family endonuclease